VLIAKVLAATVLAVLGVAVASAASAVGTLLTPALTSDSSAWSLPGAHLGQVALIQVIGVLIGVAFGMALLSSPLAIVLPTVVTILVTAVAALAWVRDWLDLTTTSAPMYMGALEGEGWLRIATSTGVWLLLPLVVGWIRIERREIG
jgi:ABC-2 type transport system permease protein